LTIFFVSLFASLECQYIYAKQMMGHLSTSDMWSRKEKYDW